SRRRHTRFSRDWSSDVCSSDLALMCQESRGAHYRSDFPILDDEKWNVNIHCRKEGEEMALFKQQVKEIKGPLADLLKAHVKPEQIGRASCREREKRREGKRVRK